MSIGTVVLILCSVLSFLMTLFIFFVHIVFVGLVVRQAFQNVAEEMRTEKGGGKGDLKRNREGMEPLEWSVWDGLPKK